MSHLNIKLIASGLDMFTCQVHHQSNRITIISLETLVCAYWVQHFTHQVNYRATETW